MSVPSFFSFPSRVTAFVLLLCGAAAAPLYAQVDPGEPPNGEVLPWLTPERAGEYLLITTGRDRGLRGLAHMTVYHVPTREVVAEDWRGPVGGWGGDSGGWGIIARLIHDAPNRLWRGRSVLNLEDGRSVPSPAWERQTHAIAADQRRAVIIERGDIWRGELDWASGEIINRQQVTRVGVFTERMRPLLWHGNDIYLEAGLDRDKPIVRVNLVSGELEELAVPPAFDRVVGTPAQRRRVMGHNPPSWLIVRPEGQVVHTLDLRTGQAGTLPNPAPAVRHVSQWSGEDLHWLDDVTAVVGTTVGIFRFDFAAGRVSELTSFHEMGSAGSWVRSLDDSLVSVSIRSILPDGHWAMVSAQQALPLPTGGRGEQIAYYQQQSNVPLTPFLLHLETGEIEPVNVEGDPPDLARGGSPLDDWLDDRYYVFSRQRGGLAQIGTWLYDRETGETRRLSPTPSAGGRMFYPESRTIVFAVLPAGGGLGTRTTYLVNVDGTGLTELPVAGNAGRIAADPIDLGFGEARAGLWAEPEYDLEVTTAATQETDSDHSAGPPTVGPTDEMRLERAIADMSDEDRAIVQRAFKQVQDDVRLHNHFDPLAFALRFQTEYRRLEPAADRPFHLPGDGGWTITWQHVFAEGDFRSALSRERMVQVVGARAEVMSGDADWFTPEVKQAIGERYADEAVADPQRISSPRQASRLFVEVLTEQRRLAQQGDP